MDVESAVGSLFAPEGRQDPYPAYDVLRAHAPAFQALDDRWFVTTHALTNKLLREPSLRVADVTDYDRSWPDWRENRGVASIVQSMLMTNPPDHTRMRRAAAATFTARRVRALRDVIGEPVDELVDAMPARADFISAFAYPLLGGGAHYCLGAPLARLEAQVAFPRLLDRLPGLRLAGPGERRDRLVLRGYAALPVATG